VSGIRAGAAHYALLEMARRTIGPRRTDSHWTYVRGTRIIAGLSVLVLSRAIVWDLVNDGPGMVASGAFRSTA
jgi:hypothetical protein